MTTVPTEEQFKKAHEYAMKKLCNHMGNEKYAPNLTTWDSTDKKCYFTERGCDSTRTDNPFSKPSFDSQGNPMEYSANNPVYGKLWKYIYPRELVWKKLSDGTMGCGTSNSLFKRFCEVPVSRHDKEVRGITNVPPFHFTVEDGVEVCKITQEYCSNMGVSFDTGKGECVVPFGQKVGEFFGGVTLSRSIRSGRISDKRLKTNINILNRDSFGPGKHIYIYNWTEIAQHLYGKPKVDFGPIADDYDDDEIFYDEYGYKNIDTSKSLETKIFYKVKDIL